jgi:hypothetical protein
VRAEAPIPVQARFRWNGKDILEGHLEVELREGNEVLGRYRSSDLDLTTGEQTIHLVLPPCLDSSFDPQVEAHTKFVTARQVFDLGYSILSMPAAGERSFVLGWCNPRFGADQQSAAPQNFLFERLAPPTANAARKLLITSVARLAPEDLPTQPLAYTPFDVMVLTGEGFKEAREVQLRALIRWVKGGGSLCVYATGGLRPYHFAFLNELAGASAIDPAFVADSDGNPIPGPKKISRLYTGLGRSVIVVGNPALDATTDQSDWRRAVAFLWKFHAPQEQAIAETGYWATNTTEPAAYDQQAQLQQYQRYQQSQRNPRRFRQPNFNVSEMPSYSIQQSPLGQELMTQLMPRTVRLIPFAALMGTLGLFLLMIGPVDYFVLGWMRRRKYTWILFPVTSLVFMIATVMMANYYLGLRDQRRSLILVDLDKDGTALRWNRFELIFAARDKQAVTELKDALWAPLDFPTMQVGMPYNPGYAYPNGPQRYNYNAYPNYPVQRAARLGDSGPPWYEGSVPVRFRTSQSINQWQPKLNRIFSFEPPPVPLLSNWSEVEKAWPDLKAVRSKLSGKKVFTGNLCAISSAGAVTFDSGFENQPGAQPASPPVEIDYNPDGLQPYHVTLNGTNNWILGYPTLVELCLSQPTHLQSLVSQVSPNGGGNFEDTPAMDRNTDSALLIVTETGDDIVVYRRFFHGK